MAERSAENLSPCKIQCKIQDKDLEFVIQYIGIKEIDDILWSLDSMKAKLKQSLEKQWKSEQTRKIWIFALAHDIKTVLTIVRGNTNRSNESTVRIYLLHY